MRVGKTRVGTATGRNGTRALLLCAAALLGLILPGAQQSSAAELPVNEGQAKAGTAEKTGGLLDASSPFRFFMVGKTEQARINGELRTVGFSWNYKLEHPPMRTSSNPPPGWFAPDFDDARWPRARMPFRTGRVHDHMSGLTRDFSLLCARGTFQVDDPARARDLALELSYRGGVVVFLNGKELARGHMPAGEVTPDTPSEDYPREAYVDPDGTLLPRGTPAPATHKERYAGRDRRLEAKVPAGLLVRGVNVLAIQAHRPLTDTILFTGKPPKSDSIESCQWETLALLGLRLTGSGAAASGRQNGLKAWNQLPAQPVTAADFAAAGETLRPVRIFAARNGAFSGQAVLGSDAPIRGLKAVASVLSSPAGRIDAAAVEVRFGLADRPAAGDVVRFDSLSAAAPAEVAVQGPAAVVPLWITVNVSTDAAAGQYAGRIAVTADGGARLEVPLVVEVADWTLAPVTESQSWWWLAQSPDTLAMAYGAPMWSDRHVELIGRSFALSRQVGTRIIYVPLFPGSYLGNEHGMIRWVKGSEGSWKCDFTAFEKYLDAAVKNLGKLDVVCIHCWPKASGGSFLGSTREPIEGRAPYPYTLIDPKTGGLTNAQGPTWDDAEPIRALLKPAFVGIRERLKARGVDEKALMLGIGHDIQPNKNAIAALGDASGGAPWVLHAHRLQWEIHGARVGYLADVFGSPGFGWPGGPRRYGWRQERFHATFPRITSKTIDSLDDNSPPAQYRASCEAAMLSGMRGFGWVGADCWPVQKDPRGRLKTLLEPTALDGRWNLGIHWSVMQLLGRGPDGPLPTVRQQMVRAGLQEAEARAFIEQALVDAGKRARLGEELAGRCQKLLDDRQSALMWTRRHWDMLLVADWDRRAADLFAAAGEVAGKLK